MIDIGQIHLITHTQGYVRHGNQLGPGDFWQRLALGKGRVDLADPFASRVREAGIDGAARAGTEHLGGVIARETATLPSP
jgi:hypothetical protein